jgi:hypothetical protein
VHAPCGKIYAMEKQLAAAGRAGPTIDGLAVRRVSVGVCCARTDRRSAEQARDFGGYGAKRAYTYIWRCRCAPLPLPLPAPAAGLESRHVRPSAPVRVRQEVCTGQVRSRETFLQTYMHCFLFRSSGEDRISYVPSSRVFFYRWLPRGLPR